MDPSPLPAGEVYSANVSTDRAVAWSTSTRASRRTPRVDSVRREHVGPLEAVSNVSLSPGRRTTSRAASSGTSPSPIPRTPRSTATATSSSREGVVDGHEARRHLYPELLARAVRAAVHRDEPLRLQGVQRATPAREERVRRDRGTIAAATARTGWSPVHVDPDGAGSAAPPSTTRASTLAHQQRGLSLEYRAARRCSCGLDAIANDQLIDTAPSTTRAIARSSHAPDNIFLVKLNWWGVA